MIIEKKGNQQQKERMTTEDLEKGDVFQFLKRGLHQDEIFIKCDDYDQILSLEDYQVYFFDDLELDGAPVKVLNARLVIE